MKPPTDEMPEEAQREWAQELDRRQKAYLRFIGRWPNYADFVAFAELGAAIATIDCFGGDVEGFLAELRRREPRPDFVIRPNPKARS